MDTTASSSATRVAVDPPTVSDLTPIAIAARGQEVTGLEIFQRTTDDITAARAEELVSEMNADKPTGGTDMAYENADAQRLCFWKAKSSKAPIVLFVHGGSWRSGTYLDSIGSAKVGHLTGEGYAFATINYTLITSVTVEEQVQQVANSLGYLVKKAAILDFDPKQVVLMGHIVFRSGPVAENTIYGLGTDPKRLLAMSPTYHARAPNAHAFLFLHVHRQGDIRQAVELAAALNAAGTDAALHVFEGQGFEGHVQMLLRLGNPAYPATLVIDNWLKMHVPVS